MNKNGQMQNPLKFSIKSLISFLSIILLLCFFACKGSSEEGAEGEQKKNPLSSLATSSGRIDEIMVIIDDEDWQDSLGLALRNVLQEAYPSLPQPEPRFSLRQMQPSGLTTLLKKASSMLVVANLSDEGPTAKYVKEQLKRFEAEGKTMPKNMFTLKDIWAQPQQMVFVFGQTEEELKKYLVNKKAEIIRRLYVVENQKATNNLYASRTNQKLTAQVKEVLGIDIAIPNSFKLVELNDTLLWVRQDIEMQTDNVMIHVKPYTDQKQFSGEHAIATRDQLGRMFTTDTPDSFAKSDTVFGAEHQQVVINGTNMVESRGLWRMTEDFMGGPFVNYLMIDEKTNRVIIFDGFVFAPDYKKRRGVRKLEMLARQLKF